ncbi:cobaltochelatase subunit CobN [Pseudoroseomonas wenyumeiae]|uniref:Cobaltochelatase subunit CobN n=1 Tax=Teichococcus wenyumeiae TaxID=2478470 RepID=A0A3A9JGI6_9PROT|nr:cobaltochelatase subunit CobN [Pseudoroseomonas wenyumeiae]RKK03625.1 cobaltochelatase subunit CobN [Pseudoroseomonas wenyumeiae]RMI27152.1 cobaltochelatase subunit CobN [Pseudoroseomonas wenyumeiae]
MHLLPRETLSLDAAEQAVDLGHAPADLVLLSFSDSDLSAAAAGWAALPEPRPTLRLASLAKLRHPMSVDLYAEQVLAESRVVIIRLLGGLDYWRYGAEEVAALCRARGIPLALLPGEGRPDTRLAELSTMEPALLARLEACCRHGGAAHWAAALQLAAASAGLGTAPAADPPPLPAFGCHDFGITADGPDAALVFYRSHLLADDVAPMRDLAKALSARGLNPRGFFAVSLKDAEAARFIATELAQLRPAVVLNATAFSARQEGASPLDAAGAPVLQLMLSGAPHAAWEASSRGLSQADLAMQVVLPELDGRLPTTIIGFKAEAAPLPGLDFSPTRLQPFEAGIALAADRAAGWALLRATPPAARRLAIILSDYPGVAGSGQVGHAVGLDSFASLAALLEDLCSAGYGTEALDAAALTRALTAAPPTAFLNLRDYAALFATVPAALREAVEAAWGAPEQDPALTPTGFALRHLRIGHMLLAVQPDRGREADRRATHHDPSLPPRHAFIAFYLWLREAFGAHALLHLGTHGSLEWLPGKAVALSESCAPAALTRGLPVIYPFIVNNPGEAAFARRRLGAVTIGHLTPPLKSAGHHGAAAELERLIDEYAAADGLDARRTALLRRDILARAQDTGLLAESAIPPGLPEEETLAKLDAWLCDVKEMQIREGLHVLGRPPAGRDALLAALQTANPDTPDLAARLDVCAEAERNAVLAALDARFIAPGPAGAPTRGRADVLPTGRNLYAVDPRGIPSRSAMLLAEKAAAELLRRHLQDHGEYPRALVLDLWGSTTLRTGGEDLALALVLLGVRPLWDSGSARVTGTEILPLALLDRPRIDVTLRISGLFRDTFASQIALFDQAVRAVAARDEAADWNPLAGTARGLSGDALRQATARIFGAAPGTYGLDMDVAGGNWKESGAAYLAASASAYGQGLEGAPLAGSLAERIRTADAFLHSQDHAETDLLDSPDFAAHEGGFAAAARVLGAAPALYHLDTSRPEAPRSRALEEEIARVVRARAVNPAWIGGMMRHGYRGAAEIARPLHSLHAFAATLPTRLDRQFDLIFEATLGTPDVLAFLQRENPEALAGMRQAFAAALRQGLWQPRRNSVAAELEA